MMESMFNSSSRRNFKGEEGLDASGATVKVGGEQPKRGESINREMFVRVKIFSYSHPSEAIVRRIDHWSSFLRTAGVV